MSERRPTALSAAIAAWIGFPIGAIFATVSPRWWLVWVIAGMLLAAALTAHIRHHRKDHPT